jgi:hypothetical protein
MVRGMIMFAITIIALCVLAYNPTRKERGQRKAVRKDGRWHCVRGE